MWNDDEMHRFLQGCRGTKDEWDNVHSDYEARRRAAAFTREDFLNDDAFTDRAEVSRWFQNGLVSL